VFAGWNKRRRPHSRIHATEIQIFIEVRLLCPPAL
jgi:hypothetical protein